MATPIPANRAHFELAEIARATGGRLLGSNDIRCTSVSIDTRTLEAGALFVALRGAGDGHAYLAEAARRGASAAVVERGRAHGELPCVEVSDTLEALGQIAHQHLEELRSARPLPSIAIGGAAGKTTTKELCAAAARVIFGPTLATAANQNNRIGVPMTLLTLTGEHNAMVIECGTNHRGEIPALARIVEPDVAMVLNVDIEHSEGLGTLEQIADEEAALFAGARKIAVGCTEEPLVISRITFALPTVTFGTSPTADVRLVGRAIGAEGRSRVTLKVNPRLVANDESPLVIFELGLLGATAALNCAAALAGVIAMSPAKLSGEQLDAIGAALAKVAPVARRLCPRVIGDLLVIDDSYNSSPRALRVGVETAREVAQGLGRRLVIVLGDMLELGALTASSHADAIRAALEARPAALVVAGPAMSAALAAAHPDTVAHATRDSTAAAATVRELVRPGDVVLVKGSLGTAMDRVVETLARG